MRRFRIAAVMIAAYIGILQSGACAWATTHLGRSAWYGVTPRMFRAADRVSLCEEGGDWHFHGLTYDGGLGWTIANWRHFRKPWWPLWMHQATPHQQANALYRFCWAYRIALPDQHGLCAGY